MTVHSEGRITIDQVDQSKPMADWKPLLSDFGRRRHLSYTLDFDTRAYVFDEPGDGWAEEPRRIHLENRERARAALGREFGADNLDRKIENFRAIGVKPFSVVSYHNRFFDEVRRAFVMGAYYPALVGACALGERVLNHLILDIRDFYKHTQEYVGVRKQRSFANWKLVIDTLEAWNVLLPKAVIELRALMELLHRSIHFNDSTYANLQEDSLASIQHMNHIIDLQFSAFADRPWFIPGTRGYVFIRREWESEPFIKTYYLPSCPFVGPYFSISFDQGLTLYDHPDYGDGDWTDEEFATAFETRSPEQLATAR
jgi:hypothetical protein